MKRKHIKLLFIEDPGDFSDLGDFKRSLGKKPKERSPSQERVSPATVPSGFSGAD